MAQFIQTHINAFYEDLATAKKELAVAEQRVTELEEAIIAKGGKLPLADGTIPEADAEDTAHSSDVSAAEDKPVEKYNRDELDAYAHELGLKPEKYETKKELLEAIRVAESAGGES
jgi:hypothetical protein